MKLLITLDFFPERGGIQRYLSGIVKHAYTADDQVLVGCATLPDCNGSGSELSVAPKYVTSIFSPINKKASLVALLFAFLKVCRKNRGTVTVYCGNLYAALVPWVCSFVNKQPYRLYVYGTELEALRVRPVARLLFLSVLNRAEKIISIGGYTSRLLDILKVHGSREIQVPKIDLPLSLQGRCGSIPLQLPQNQPCRILCVGRFVSHKGHEILLRALAGLTYPFWELHLIGSGVLEKHYYSLIKSLGIEDRVVIKTACPDSELAQEYAQAHLFVLPSLQTSGGSEGFGIVLLEAMAHGVAIVASACGGIPEVLDNDNAGILVPPADVASLQTAIKTVLTDSALRQTLVSQAYCRLKEHYVFE